MLPIQQELFILKKKECHSYIPQFTVTLSRCQHACMCTSLSASVCVCVCVCVMCACVCVHACRAAERRGGGQLGHFALDPTLLIGPKRSIYFDRTVKYSIKAVTTYICPGLLKLSRLPCVRARVCVCVCVHACV